MEIAKYLVIHLDQEDLGEDFFALDKSDNLPSTFLFYWKFETFEESKRFL